MTIPLLKREPLLPVATALAVAAILIALGERTGSPDALAALTAGAATTMVLATAIERRHLTMLGWFGLAVAIDAHALFLAPFAIGLLIERRVPLHRWLVAPLTAIVATLPARPIDLHLPDTVALSDGAPNLWTIVQPLAGGIPLLGLALAAAIGIAAAYTAWLTTRRLAGADLIAAALLAPLLMAGMLPGMDAGSFYLAGILALVLAVVARDRWPAAALVQAGAILALAAAETGIGSLATLGAFATIAATLLVARPLLRPAANDNPVYPRAAIA